MLLALRRLSRAAPRAAPVVVSTKTVTRYASAPIAYPSRVLEVYSGKGRGGTPATATVPLGRQDPTLPVISRYPEPAGAVTRLARPMIDRYAGGTPTIRVGPRIDKLLGLPIPSAPIKPRVFVQLAPHSSQGTTPYVDPNGVLVVTLGAMTLSATGTTGGATGGGAFPFLSRAFARRGKRGPRRR